MRYLLTLLLSLSLSSSVSCGPRSPRAPVNESCHVEPHEVDASLALRLVRSSVPFAHAEAHQVVGALGKLHADLESQEARFCKSEKPVGCLQLARKEAVILERTLLEHPEKAGAALSHASYLTRVHPYCPEERARTLLKLPPEVLDVLNEGRIAGSLGLTDRRDRKFKHIDSYPNWGVQYVLAWWDIGRGNGAQAQRRLNKVRELYPNPEPIMESNLL